MILCHALPQRSDSDKLTLLSDTSYRRAETSDEPSNMVNGSLNSSLTGKGDLAM